MRLSAVADLQNQYNSLMKHGMTKKQLCDLVIPFRDRWELTDKQALAIARGEMSLQDAAMLMAHNDEHYLLSVLKTLHSEAPMPWKVRGDDLSSYIYDAKGHVVCGGENSEGRVDYSDPWVEPLIEMTEVFYGMEMKK